MIIIEVFACCCCFTFEYFELNDGLFDGTPYEFMSGCPSDYWILSLMSYEFVNLTFRLEESGKVSVW